ncbi:Thioredoxin-like protein [Cryptosporidium felis]|nr:Thioredoxin-like protein [Cryptosporidium felis]
MYGKEIGSGVQATPAEVVLIHTSLSGVRRHYYGSLRAKQFLDVKGVVYYQIDANRDFSIAANLGDSEIFDSLKNEGMLKMDPLESDGTILLPQVFVDGVYIGNDVSLQDLEEDNDFDWIINRRACGACLSDKEEDAEICPNCNQVFKTIVPPELVYSGGVQQIYRGNNTATQGVIFEHPTNFVKRNNSGNFSRNERYENYQDEDEYSNIAEEEYSEVDIKGE